MVLCGICAGCCLLWAMMENRFVDIATLAELRRVRKANAMAAEAASSRIFGRMRCWEHCLSPEYLFGNLLRVAQPLVRLWDMLGKFARG